MPRSSLQPVLVPQLAADALLLLEQRHRPVQIPSGLEDQRLVAEAGLQPVLVPQFAADALLLLVQRHRPVQIPSGLEDHRLVAEGRLQPEPCSPARGRCAPAP